MKRAVRRALLLSALAAPSTLYALGLGEIRLNSALNQPFDAEIELVSATPEDISALSAAVASGEAFQRYGLDRPAFLSEFTFRVSRSGGRDVLRITSPRPVTEPFVTLLVEASWPRGRLLREYTVLLDPPVYASAPAVAAPVATPRASAPPVVAAPQPQPAAPTPAPSPAPVPPEQPRATSPRATVEPGSTYRVRPNDTLWQIASAANPGPRAEVNRTMVAIYAANPAAFGGNINVLRAGSELRIPTSSDVAAISAAAAADEVARQYRLWTAGQVDAGTRAAETPGRLLLVTPEQGTSATAPTTAAPAAAPSAATPDLEERLRRLEKELAETRRLLEVRSAELDTLRAGAEPAPAEPGVGAEAAAPGEPGAGAEAAAPVAPVPDVTPGEVTAEPVPEPEAAVPPPKPKPKPTPPVETAPEPSLLERLGQYWWALLLPLLAALGIAAWLRRRRVPGETGESLEETLGRQADLRGRSTLARSPESEILVEERVPATAMPAAVARAPEPARQPPTVADTLSGDAAVSIEASDPLAEADFHMAYGLYDQAADLVQLAIKREPRRRDLKLKLVEIFFVWGNRERFLELAREMHATRGEAESGEWDKILIMGRQLAPEDALFAGTRAAAAADLDLELHAGAAPTDFELPGGAGPRPDLDLTIRTPEVRKDDGIDFLLDEPVRGGGTDDSALAPTVEAPRPRGPVDETTAEVPIEDLGLDTSALDELSRLDKTIDKTIEKTIEKTVDIAKLQVEDTVQETVLNRAADAAAEPEEDLLSSTSLMRMETGEFARLEATARETAVLDLSDATGEMPALAVENLETTGEITRLEPRSDEDSTMSEVGTKLDLARAYVDMGDPEGARSILEEVLKEGNAAHKLEAERLLAGLP